MAAVKRENSLRTLRRLTRRAPVQEHCELCSVALSPTHRHLLELVTRRLFCSCDPCALRFQNVLGGRFKLVPRDTRELPDFQITDADWERLALPINLAFFFHNTATGKMTAMYPSPAGATASLLTLEHWKLLAEENPALRHLEPDVEALLVNRVGAAPEHYIAPIDLCYELVGLIRTHWRGFAGGEVVWQEVEKFFTRIRQQAQPVPIESEAAHA